MNVGIVIVLKNYDTEYATICMLNISVSVFLLVNY